MAGEQRIARIAAGRSRSRLWLVLVLFWMLVVTAVLRPDQSIADLVAVRAALQVDPFETARGVADAEAQARALALQAEAARHWRDIWLASALLLLPAVAFAAVFVRRLATRKAGEP